MSKIQIAVIGGGAAGFFSAISAAQHNPEAEVSIYEASKQVLSKVLISGGGRCNVTNNTLEPSELVKNYPRGSKELRGPFSRFNANHTIEWFESRGVQLKAEADRRMFPITDNSSTIANCLSHEAESLGVKLNLNSKLSSIELNQPRESAADAKFKLNFWNGGSLTADRLILTTGGSKSSFDLAAQLGHTINQAVPSLFSFEINDERFFDLAGVSFQNAQLKLKCHNSKVYEQKGPILITHWGLSGPATIKLSALAAIELFQSDYKADLQINFIGDTNGEIAFNQLKQYKQRHPNKKLYTDSHFDIAKSYWLRILELMDIPPYQIFAETSDKQLRWIASELTAAQFKILAKGKFKDEFVTCGGVELKEVNFTSMESRVCPGLYFAGEVLNIDGLTGGFNFQSAWTTGWIAGWQGQLQKTA